MPTMPSPARVHVEGFIVKDYRPRPSNWRSEMALGEYLEQAGVRRYRGYRHARAGAPYPHARRAGGGDFERHSRSRRAGRASAKASPGLVGRDLVKEVTCAEPYDWDLGDWELGGGYRRPAKEELRDAPLIVALDYGIKRNILRRLVASGFRVRVMPAAASAADILAPNPDGVFLSNGPADPAALPYASEAVRGVLGKQADLRHLPRPSDSRTRARRADLQARLRPSWRQSSGDGSADAQGRDHFAESRLRGGRRFARGTRGAFASQSQRQHGRRVCCGVGVPFFSVQYHPEASPGPHDAGYLFARFRRLVEDIPAIRRGGARPHRRRRGCRRRLAMSNTSVNF